MFTRKLLGTVLVVLVLAALVLSSSAPVFSQGQGSGDKQKVKEWYADKIKKEKEKKEKRITPADRLAAADRAAADGFALEAMEAAAALPGETPRYFSHANYANSVITLNGHISMVISI